VTAVAKNYDLTEANFALATIEARAIIEVQLGYGEQVARFGVRYMKDEFTTNIESADTVDGVTEVLNDTINKVNEFKTSMRTQLDDVLAFGE
jgi:hypothetical protein